MSHGEHPTLRPQDPNIALPVRVPLVTEPWGILKSLQMARKNVLSIIPEIATRQPMVSGKTGKRWHMVMDPDAIREMLLDRLDQYPKSEVTTNLLKPAIGDSLLLLMRLKFLRKFKSWYQERRLTILKEEVYFTQL